MTVHPKPPGVLRFGTFEVEPRTGELRKAGVKIRLQDQPLQILLMLLRRPGEVVTREEIQAGLWPSGTVVEFEHSIGTAIKKLRQALGDDADTPRYIETLPRRGFRFIFPVSAADPLATQDQGERWATPRKQWRTLVLVGLILAIAIGAVLLRREYTANPGAPRTLTRLTFDSGLQFEPTWSPDGRFIAYSSDRGGKFDIWVQPVDATNPVKITTRPGHNWQPDWSPDGTQIAFRSEGEGGGLFVVPAFGGPERKISSFGYRPRWSPDGRLILFGNTLMPWSSKLYVLELGGPPREILTEFLRRISAKSVDWYPASRRLVILGESGIWRISLNGTGARQYSETAKAHEQLDKVGDYWQHGFRLGPSGEAIYIDGVERGVRNLWKIKVNPSAMRLLSMERLTTGPGPDTDLALSVDGKKLAFAARRESIRIWVYGLNSKTGGMDGEGRPVTPSGVEAWEPELSGDGKKLVYVAHRSGGEELWEKSMPDGSATLLTPVKPWHGSLYTLYPRWSPDGKHLAFRANTNDILGPVLLPESGGSPEVLASVPYNFHDWLPDGQWFVSRVDERDQDGKGKTRVLLMPISAVPHPETKAREVTSSTDYVDEIRASPDGRWLAFQGVEGRSGNSGPSGSANSILYVVSLSGGVWVPITDGAAWDDKPRWSRNSKLIYFISSRAGLFNVWAMPFDAERARPIGQPFQVTKFDSPDLAVADDLGLNSLSISDDRFALSMKETSGSIWALDDVDR